MWHVIHAVVLVRAQARILYHAPHAAGMGKYKCNKVFLRCSAHAQAVMGQARKLSPLVCHAVALAARKSRKNLKLKSLLVCMMERRFVWLVKVKLVKMVDPQEICLSWYG